MNISLYYWHIDAIELGLAWFITQIGSLLNTATSVDVASGVVKQPQRGSTGCHLYHQPKTPKTTSPQISNLS